MGGDGIGFAEALLGLDGFRVLGVGDLDGEVVVLIETTAERVGCSGLRGGGGSAGPDGGRDPGPGLLRAAGPAAVGEAALAVPRTVV